MKKKITKKEIQSTLRSLDCTRIHRLCKLIEGNCEKRTVMRFIEKYAPTKKVYRKAYDLSYNRGYMRHPYLDGGYVGSKYKHIVDYMLENIKLANEGSAYAKVPMMGYTNLYFCSPDYGHSDYNKWRAISIAGNERFCEAVMRYAAKHIINKMED